MNVSDEPIDDGWDDEPIQPPRGGGPGELLRHGREAKGLTREQVAARLHLGVAIIAAVEENAYDRLPEIIFVRGYLRNYARLLDLPAEEVLAALDGAVTLPEPSQLVSHPPVDSLVTRRRPRRPLPWLWIGAALLLAAAVGWWWYSGGKWLSSDAPLSLEGESKVVELGPPPVPTEHAASSAESGPLGGVPAGDVAPPSEEAAGDVAPPSASGAFPTPVGEPAGNGGYGAATSPKGGAAPATPPAAAAPAVPPGMMQVKVSANKECWTEVVDADGKKLVFGTVKPGGDREVTGRPPFRVLLGNALAITMAVDGKPFDVMANAKNNIARFTIGSKGEAEAPRDALREPAGGTH